MDEKVLLQTPTMQELGVKSALNLQGLIEQNKKFPDKNNAFFAKDRTNSHTSSLSSNMKSSQ